MKRQSVWSTVILWVCGYLLVAWLALLVAQSIGEGGLLSLIENLGKVMEQPFSIVWTEHSRSALLIATMGYLLSAGTYYATRRNTREGEEHGSATWGNPHQVNQMLAQKPLKNNLLLTRHVRLGLDSRKHRRNLNILVIGGSGAGKSRSHVIPALLNCGAMSYVITDPKQEVLNCTGNVLKANGYDIRVLNLVNMEQSDGYNPFVYIKNEADVLRLVTNLIQATTPPNSHESDPFWTKAETALLQALILYLHSEAPEYEQNFSMVLRMMEYAEVKEEDEEYESPLDLLFMSLEREQPEHIAVRQYKVYKQAAGKTAKSILVSAAVRLAPFNLPQIRRLTEKDEMDLWSVGEKLTAIYAVIPDNDISLNFLVSMLYFQLFQTLYYSADQLHGGRLPIHTHFLLDEFSNVNLKGVDREISTMRSREISVSVIIQNLAQIKAQYKDTWETIPGNTDSVLYLGGNESSTHKVISESYLGKSTIDTTTHGQSKGRSGSYSTNYQITGRELLQPDEVRRLDNDYALLFIRGVKPIVDKKYDMKAHPNYRLCADSGAAPYIHRKPFLEGAPLFLLPEETDKIHEKGELHEAVKQTQ